MKVASTCEKIRKYVTGHNKSTKTFKHRVHMHADFMTEIRNNAVIKIHSIKDAFSQH